MEKEPPPLEIILNDVEHALQAKLYYLALHLALAVPDICSALETKPEDRERWKPNERYVAWCKTYFEPQFSQFTAEDCWALRGGVIHNGMLFGHPKLRFSLVVFSLPRGGSVNENISESADGSKVLQMDVGIFCHRMRKAAMQWYNERKNEPIVAANLPNLVRLRPDGFSNDFVGTPVIA